MLTVSLLSAAQPHQGQTEALVIHREHPSFTLVNLQGANGSSEMLLRGICTQQRLHRQKCLKQHASRLEECKHLQHVREQAWTQEKETAKRMG
jgi:hypothetical protein